MGGDGEDWWRGAVIYQVYPRSFRDANGDGVGDLAGITERLDYVAGLGVDAVWISPFFKSPMKDYGYDVEDYRAVDPLFGRLEDFDRLLARAHELGLRVMVDMVLSHTSDRHPWFLESREGRDNAKAEWYVWADARPDGTAPNNWLSVFGGVAWEWEPRRGQYYLHNFLAEQPDLNIHNPEVVEALLGEAEFWLARGVDGFRLDAIDFAMHDPWLRSNPPRPPGEAPASGLEPGNPYTRQVHLYDKAQPGIRPRLLRPLRELAERFGAAALLGELSGDGALDRAAEYTRGGDGLHFAYTFDLLTCPLTPAAIRGVTGALEARIGDGWPCWSFGNHDVVRPVTRFGGDDPPEALRRLLPALLASLRGTVCLYQGEELGLGEAALAFEQLRDPYGIAFYPHVRSRDGCRTPLPWRRDAPHGGFTAAAAAATAAEPWLPVPEAHRRRAVDVQEADPGSVLAQTRRFLHWRRRHPALVRGGKRFLDAPDPLLALVRGPGDRAGGGEGDGREVLCLFNLGPGPARFAAPEGLRPLDGHGFPVDIGGGTINLPGYGAFFGELPPPAAGGGAAPARREA